MVTSNKQSSYEPTYFEFVKHWDEKHYHDSHDIDLNKVIKKEARGINDADFGEIQLTM
jgi:hypothetical protein